MTAPEQPTSRELLRELTQEAIDNGSYGEPAPEHAHKPNEQAGEQAIRDRIAEALNHAFAYVTASGQGTTTGFVAWTDFADAVMAVVQPELDRRDREIEQLTIAAKVNIGLYRSAERDAAEQTKRAEAAEAQLRDQQNGDQT